MSDLHGEIPKEMGNLLPTGRKVKVSHVDDSVGGHLGDYFKGWKKNGLRSEIVVELKRGAKKYISDFSRQEEGGEEEGTIILGIMFAYCSLYCECCRRSTFAGH